MENKFNIYDTLLSNKTILDIPHLNEQASVPYDKSNVRTVLDLTLAASMQIFRWVLVNCCNYFDREAFQTFLAHN